MTELVASTLRVHLHRAPHLTGSMARASFFEPTRSEEQMIAALVREQEVPITFKSAAVYGQRPLEIALVNGYQLGFARARAKSARGGEELLQYGARVEAEADVAKCDEMAAEMLPLPEPVKEIGAKMICEDTIDLMSAAELVAALEQRGVRDAHKTHGIKKNRRALKVAEATRREMRRSLMCMQQSVGHIGPVRDLEPSFYFAL